MHNNEYQSVDGMTVNERLYHFGLASEYDAAIRASSEERAVSILMRAELTREQAEFTARTTLADPKRYGY